MRHDIKTSEFERGKICKLTPFQNKVSLNSFKLVIGDLWYHGLIFEFAACPNRAVALCRPNNKSEKHKTSVNWWTGWKILGVRTGKSPGIGGRNHQKKLYTLLMVRVSLWVLPNQTCIRTCVGFGCG
jgi:hypothetical protein